MELVQEGNDINTPSINNSGTYYIISLRICVIQMHHKLCGTVRVMLAYLS